MLPFEVKWRTGEPVYRQIVFAVKKAVVSGRLLPGDPFPSIRMLSQELRINPNTAQKVVSLLAEEGLLTVQPGVGTTVTAMPSATKAQRQELLEDEVVKLVVEARRLSLSLEDVTEAVKEQWDKLGKN